MFSYQYVNKILIKGHFNHTQVIFDASNFMWTAHPLRLFVDILHNDLELCFISYILACAHDILYIHLIETIFAIIDNFECINITYCNNVYLNILPSIIIISVKNKVASTHPFKLSYKLLRTCSCHSLETKYR